MMTSHEYCFVSHKTVDLLGQTRIILTIPI